MSTTYSAVRDQHFAAMPAEYHYNGQRFRFSNIPQKKRDRTHARIVVLASRFKSKGLTGAEAVRADPEGFKQVCKTDILGGLIGGIMSMFGPTLLAALLAWLIPVVIQWLTDQLTKPQAAGDEPVNLMLSRLASEAGA